MQARLCCAQFASSRAREAAGPAVPSFTCCLSRRSSRSSSSSKSCHQMLFLLLAAVKHPPGQQPVPAWEAQALALCFLGRFCRRERSGPLCGGPRSQRPGCLLGAVCRRGGLEQLRRGWAVPLPAKVPGALSRRRLSGQVENGTSE